MNNTIIITKPCALMVPQRLLGVEQKCEMLKECHVRGMLET